MRLGWRVTNATLAAKNVCPGPLRFYNATWATRVTVLSQGAYTTAGAVATSPALTVLFAVVVASLAAMCRA